MLNSSKMDNISLQVNSSNIMCSTILFVTFTIFIGVNINVTVSASFTFLDHVFTEIIICAYDS
jgi:hypothetical protein